MLFRSLALRTQQVLAHEAGVTGTVDPLGGSWAIEALTDAVEADALALIAETDRLGGAVPAISAGFPQRAIHDAAFAYQREVESGERVIVGVNRFVEEQMSTPPIVRIDPAREREQVAALAAFRATRDAAAIARSIAAIKAAANGLDNLMPLLIDGVKAGLTVGEISGALREVWGEHRESSHL